MQIIAIECPACKFKLPSIYVIYVTDSNGQRLICPHPCEGNTIWEILSKELNWLQRLTHKIPSSMIGIKRRRTFVQKLLGYTDLGVLFDTRTGTLVNLMCFDCNSIFKLDLKRDSRVCPTCNSYRVVETTDLTGKPCPKCKEAIITAKDTGIEI